MVAVKYDITIS